MERDLGCFIMYTCLSPGRAAGVFLGCSCENTMGFLEAKPMMYRGPLESLTLVQSTLGLQQKCQTKMSIFLWVSGSSKYISALTLWDFLSPQIWGWGEFTLKLQFFDESKKMFCFVLAFSHYKDKNIYFQDIYMLELNPEILPTPFQTLTFLSWICLLCLMSVSIVLGRASICRRRDVVTARTDPHICTLAPASSL